MSYGIANIIDCVALQSQSLSCFSVANVHEYSSPESYSDEISAIYLREYQSMPAVYQMKYDITGEGVRHEIKAEFYYTKVNRVKIKKNFFTSFVVIQKKTVPLLPIF